MSWYERRKCSEASWWGCYFLLGGARQNRLLPGQSSVTPNAHTADKSSPHRSGAVRGSEGGGFTGTAIERGVVEPKVKSTTSVRGICMTRCSHERNVGRRGNTVNLILHSEKGEDWR